MDDLRTFVTEYDYDSLGKMKKCIYIIAFIFSCAIANSNTICEEIREFENYSKIDIDPFLERI